jgi:nicotinamide-nucleotide amidase
MFISAQNRRVAGGPALQELSVPNDTELENLVRDVAEKLISREWRMTTAESCTGGWIAKCCTDRSGSSAWFERGFVSYSDESKQDLLGVASATLETEGAVSQAVAGQMAEGARARAGVEAALSVTGIAGPDGGSEEKPVGTVWFGWSVVGRALETEIMLFQGDRSAVRRHTVAHALQGLLDRL